MKFITFNLSDDLILTPSCADAVYALENDSTELMINHKIKEGMVYELHKEQNGRKDFVTLEKADDHLYYILNNSFLKTSGRCSLQIRMIGEGDFAQHSNKVEISIGTFINAKNEPSPVQKQVIEDLLVASDKNLETTKTLLSEADILKDKAADLETLDVKDNGEGIDVYYKGVQYHLYDGAKGDKGDKGDVGPQGPQGIPGADGRDGMDGAPGPKGDKGDTGEKGATGPRGYTGERGPQGAQGYQGPRGPVGAQGERGEPGTDGFSPIANVHRTEEDDGAIISITDKTGTTVAIVHDGQGGGGEGDVTKEYLEENYYNKTEVDTSFSDVIRSINDTREDVDNLINDMDSKADKTETNNKISEIEESLNEKQDTLVDGVSIKTINGEPILGEGNLVIQGGGSDVIMEDNPESGVDLRVNGTVRTLAQTSELLDGLPSESFEDNFALNNQGNKVYDTNYYVSTPIPIDAKSRITWYTNGTNGSYTLCGYDSAMNYTEYWVMNSNPRTITLSHANTAYIRATFYKGADNVHNGKITNSSGDVIYQADMSTNIDGLVNLNNRVTATESKIVLINNELPTKQDNLYLNSNDEVIVDVNSKPYVLSDKNMLLNGVDNNNYEDNMYINGNGLKVVSNDFVISKKIPISSGTKLTWYPGTTMPASSASPSICEFNINDSKIQYWTMNANPRTLTLNGSGTTYIIASFAKNGTEGSGKIVNANTGEIIYQIENKGKLYGLEGLNSKIDELQLFKFPNATIIGEPTINNGQISGFSATSYLKFPFLVDFQSRPFEINMEFTTGSNIQNQENIFDSDFGLAFAIRNSKFVIAISTNGTSWNLGEGVGTHTVLANTTYRVKLWWDRMTYHLSYSTDGGKNYTEDITKVGAYQPAPKQMYIGAGENFGEVFNWFTGIINMNHCTLSILDQIIWSGMDDAGLATRLEVDMSNIDQSGVDYINGLIEAKAKPVDMVDNPDGGVDLTVGDKTRTFVNDIQLANSEDRLRNGYFSEPNGYNNFARNLETGELYAYNGYYTTKLIPISSNIDLRIAITANVNYQNRIILLDKDKNVLRTVNPMNSTQWSTINSDEVYCYVTVKDLPTQGKDLVFMRTTGGTSEQTIFTVDNGSHVDGLVDKADKTDTETRLSALETALTGVDELIGSGVIE